MLIIPAVDIHQGKCVRLTQGRLDQETIYSNDPVFIARLWQTHGAKMLHLVDLDGAYTGCVQHWDLIKKIRESLNIKIQFGGGVRKLSTVEKLDQIGIDRIVISTIVVSNLEETKKIVKEYKDKIVVACDVKEGKISIGGWKDILPFTLKEFVQKVVGLGIYKIIITDIDKEGLLEGVDVEKLKNYLEEIKSFGLEIILSGGVTTIEDIKKIKELETYGVKGVIVGKALYAEKISFEEALKVAGK